MTEQESRKDRAAIAADIKDSLTKDRYWLQRQWRNWRRLSGKERGRFHHRLERSCAQVELRRDQQVKLNWQDSLPVVQKKDDIARLIAENQVVIVAGETGSGKTTQLPKICLELGQGIHGQIGHTQPRRLAARSVANRIAEELETELGGQVGYQVRFTDQVSEQTRVKLMTDGILLAEIQNDRFLNNYDTLIIDEAHERSLNIDFLLGYLKVILPKRPDLKLIITSATIDVERFSKHFDNAPVIEVSGRTYPVEVLYRSLADLDVEAKDADERQMHGIYQALQEIEDLERGGIGHRLGDVLIFLPGERDIRETAKFLRDRKLRDTEILPLYARLSNAEQNRIFKPHSGRRVILSTNVAETSLTVPGIHYVIDPGTARISRYSIRGKVQRLPVEAVSQASANQRKGRCGRVAEGVCIRLYDEADFYSRPEFTDAEILRTNLAAVILQMLKMGLGDVTRFPFVDRPDNKAINDGYRLLQELGAVSNDNRLTRTGRQLSQLPIDPRLGRMLLASHDTNALEELLIIASALSVQDPRERPAEKKQASDQKHREFYDDDSDFLTFVNLWSWYEQQRQELSSSQLRKLCKNQFLSFMRMREWKDMHRQLTLVCKDLKLRHNSEVASYADVHKALLTGLLSHLGNKTEEADYLGARNRKFWVFPGSGLFKRKPKWVMAAELVETSKLYARVVAKIEPSWIEPLAGHLIKRNWFEPHWEKKQARAVAYEQATLYGLVIYSRRKVHYGTIDPVVSRELLLREGLVAGQYTSNAPFFKHNQKLIEEVEELEAKSRRQDILADPETLFAFYSERVPADIVNGAGFETWRKKAERGDSQCLYLTREYLMQHDAAHVTAVQYPDRLKWEGMELPLTYHFAPGEDDDGVTVSVPVSLIQKLSRKRLEWLVPGMLEGKVIALIRSLPKQIRKNFVPVPDFAKAAMEGLNACGESLTEMLGVKLFRMTGTRIPEDAWKPETLDQHFQMNIRVLDDDGRVLGQGRDMVRLREKFAGKAQASLRDITDRGLEQSGITSWTIGELPQEISQTRGGLLFKSYPALVDEKSSVALRLFDSPELARDEMIWGLARLIRLSMPEQVRFMLKQMKNLNRITVLAVNAVPKTALLEDIELFVIRQVFLANEAEWPRNETDFRTLVARYKSELVAFAESLDKLLLDIFTRHTAIQKRLKGKISFQVALSMSDIQAQLKNLLYKGFLRQTPLEWLEQFPRYLQAVELRLDKLGANYNRDRVYVDELQHLHDAWNARREALAKVHIIDKTLWQYRWMLEEYRVSLFAQTLKTRIPVSDKRLRKVWEEIAIP
ncbi:ATP-dependent RNA helicase HrpA [Sansalvadorimonas sp. 2012CJ34-2]|uniref:ATP-dependent RNA helicase HrpA n=1 Tax=Parendozoicomonas callyspongiae TaxID=2942213 RepID=A0ABT0PD37_9GAMM|nr:ATP-dependent RNA helicase HrpA [Sansalvadorimonas sp. 2012CJ34-2]MCL6269292.1 ATP-dependent RNA helicase HrpA [Sansalvadorimonas sp. 2012CJ34-2]